MLSDRIGDPIAVHRLKSLVERIRHRVGAFPGGPGIEAGKTKVVSNDDSGALPQQGQCSAVEFAVAKAVEDAVVASARPLAEVERPCGRHADPFGHIHLATFTEVVSVDEGIDIASVAEGLEQVVARIGDTRGLRWKR